MRGKKVTIEQLFEPGESLKKKKQSVFTNSRMSHGAHSRASSSRKQNNYLDISISLPFEEERVIAEGKLFRYWPGIQRNFQERFA